MFILSMSLISKAFAPDSIFGRTVIRVVSIDEIMNDVTLIRSDLSRFSRGTVLAKHNR